MFVENVISSLSFQRKLVGKLVDELSDQQMVTQVGELVNHPAWQIGHLTTSLGGLMGMIGGEVGEIFGNQELYGKGSIPVAQQGRYASKETLLAGLDKAHEAIIAQLKTMSQEDFQKPTPHEKFAAMCPQLSNLIMLIGVSHENIHIGQLMSWRKMMGLPGVLG